MRTFWSSSKQLTLIIVFLGMSLSSFGSGDKCHSGFSTYGEKDSKNEYVIDESGTLTFKGLSVESMTYFHKSLYFYDLAFVDWFNKGSIGSWASLSRFLPKNLTSIYSLGFENVLNRKTLSDSDIEVKMASYLNFINRTYPNLAFSNVRAKQGLFASYVALAKQNAAYFNILKQAVLRGLETYSTYFQSKYFKNVVQDIKYVFNDLNSTNKSLLSYQAKLLTLLDLYEKNKMNPHVSRVEELKNELSTIMREQGYNKASAVAIISAIDHRLKEVLNGYIAGYYKTVIDNKTEKFVIDYLDSIEMSLIAVSNFEKSREDLIVDTKVQLETVNWLIDTL